MTSTISASTDPVTSDRNRNNDAATTSFPVRVEACDQSLAVDKAIIAPDTDADPDVEPLPVSRQLTYQIVVENTSE